MPLHLTDKEQAVLQNTVTLWNNLVDLPNEHPDDIHELRMLVHAIQDKLMARPMRRKLRLHDEARKLGV